MANPHVWQAPPRFATARSRIPVHQRSRRRRLPLFTGSRISARDFGNGTSQLVDFVLPPCLSVKRRNE
jgi:hypothetical protein